MHLTCLDKTTNGPHKFQHFKYDYGGMVPLKPLVRLWGRPKVCGELQNGVLDFDRFVEWTRAVHEMHVALPKIAFENTPSDNLQRNLRDIFSGWRSIRWSVDETNVHICIHIVHTYLGTTGTTNFYFFAFNRLKLCKISLAELILWKLFHYGRVRNSAKRFAHVHVEYHRQRWGIDRT